LIKTILAWSTAQIQSQIRLHVGSATLDPVPQLAARLGSNSARLNSARLASDDVAGGSHCADVPADWSMMWLMTWHAYCACWHHAYIRLMSSLACLLCMLMSLLRHADVIIIRVSHMGRVNWYSGRVSPSGRRSRVWRVARVWARGQSPLRRVTARAEVSDIRFRRGFQQWLRLFLLYTVVWSKDNFDNFHFWAKSNTPLNHQLSYQLLGNSGTPCADRGCTDSCSEKGKAHWHNILRGSANCLHPRERFILLEIEKGYNKYMEEEDYIHSTLLPALTHSCWSCCNGSSSSFSSSLHTLTFSLHLTSFKTLSHNVPPL
jgi:hypothetical protein